MKSIPSLLAGVALLLAAALPATAAPVLIGHKNVAAEKLDGATVKAVFLGKKVAWDGAGRVVLAVLKTGPVAEEIYKVHAGMNASAFNNHWRRLAMTGGGTAPKSFDTEEELRKFVAETPGAIGFVEAATADASVATLTPAS
jgi:ABC-type phosphate transport system substrate-binding protein